MVAVSDRQLLIAMIQRFEPKLRRSLLEVIDWLRSRASLAEVAQLFRAARYADIVQIDDLSAAGASFADATAAVYAAAGRELATVLSESLDARIHLDVTAIRAIRALSEDRHRIIATLTEETRANLTTVIRDGLAEGVNPKAMARAFRQSIGLAPNQVTAVANYRRLLASGSSEALDRAWRDRRHDRTVAAVAEGRRRPLSTTEIDRMVDRYAAKALKDRAESIARTEALRATHAGAEEMWRQAIDAGEIVAAELLRTWRSAHDGRVRPSHRAMDGQQRKLGEAFVSGDGNHLRYPCDSSAPFEDTIRCRCLVVTRLEQDAVAALRAA